MYLVVFLFFFLCCSLARDSSRESPKPLELFRVGSDLPFDPKQTITVVLDNEQEKVPIITDFLGIPRSPRVLFIVNMFSWAHWDVIDELFSAYRDICEGGWDVKVIILTAAKWSQRTRSWSKSNLFCYRNELSLVLEIRVFDESIGRRIVDHSRVPVRDYLDDFDVFVYAGNNRSEHLYGRLATHAIWLPLVFGTFMHRGRHGLDVQSLVCLGTGDKDVGIINRGKNYCR